MISGTPRASKNQSAVSVSFSSKIGTRSDTCPMRGGFFSDWVVDPRYARFASENRYSPCRCHAAPPRHTAVPPLSRPGRSGRPRVPIACGLSVASIGPRSTLPHRQGGAPTDESVDDPVYPIFPNGVEYILASYLFPLFFFPGIEMPSQSASPQEPCYSQNLAEPEGPPLWLRQCHCCASRLRPKYTSEGKAGKIGLQSPNRIVQ